MEAQASFFVLRTPLLAIDDLLGLSEGLRAPELATGATAPELTAALDSDRSVVAERLAAVAARPEVSVTLALASRSLSRQLAGWEPGGRSKRDLKLTAALYRYLSRMSSRPTPFGTLAGYTVGTVSDHTDLSLPGVAGYRLSLRPEPARVAAAAQRLGREAAAAGATELRANPSAYVVAGTVRHLRSAGLSKPKLSVLALTPALELVLEVTARPVSRATLEDRLGAVLSADRAAALVTGLVDRELLVPAGWPAATGVDHVRQLAERLDGTDAASDLRSALTAIGDLEAGWPSVPPGGLEAVRGRLAQPLELGADESGFHAELRKPRDGVTIDRRAVDAMLAEAELLWKLRPTGGGTGMDRFRAAFVARFGSAQVPLAEAVDPHVGIDVDAVMAPSALPPDARDSYLLALAEQALADRRLELELSDEDVEFLTVNERPPLPDAFMLLASLEAETPAALQRGDWRMQVKEFYGPSGVRTLGRFCESDPFLLDLVKEHLRAEEARSPEDVFAEVAFLPAATFAPFLWRPALREREIEYLGGSSLQEPAALRLSDLRIAAEGEELVLRSVSLGQRVRPRVSSAFNWSRHAPAVVRLLCALQNQGVATALDWDWSWAVNLPFLPRLSRGRLILTPARWLLRPRDLKLDGDAGERLREIRAWRERWQAPRWVRIQDADMGLTLDLEQAVAHDVLVHQLRLDAPVVLTEAPAELTGGCVRGPEGRFVHEILIPYVRAVPAQARAPRRVGSAEVPRRARAVYPPGSEWLRVDLDGHPDSANAIVGELLAPLADELAARDGTGWHYRAARTAPLVQIWIHDDPAVITGRWVPRVAALASPLLAGGRLHDLRLGTHRAELDEPAEAITAELRARLRAVDSHAAVICLDNVREPELRWLLTVVAADRLMSAAGLELDRRPAMLDELADTLRAAAGEPLAEARSLSLGFRRRRAQIDEALRNPSSTSARGQRALDALERRTTVAAEIFDSLRALAAGPDHPEREIAEHVRGGVERMLGFRPPGEQLRVYDHLARTYMSYIARGARP